MSSEHVSSAHSIGRCAYGTILDTFSVSLKSIFSAHFISQYASSTHFIFLSITHFQCHTSTHAVLTLSLTSFQCHPSAHPGLTLFLFTSIKCVSFLSLHTFYIVEATQRGATVDTPFYLEATTGFLQKLLKKMKKCRNKSNIRRVCCCTESGSFYSSKTELSHSKQADTWHQSSGEGTSAAHLQQRPTTSCREDQRSATNAGRTLQKNNADDTENQR